ncbi:MAG: sigma-E factor negative regulatory protein [Xanthomonadales bacterium]|nr:sigma-E factor negative regulatory protein [Xanthomonadales bacterium]
MSKESLEHLSTLMDGELSRETSIFMTRRLSSDGALSEKWERYHLIRDCIRQPGGKQLVTGLQTRITASLEAEDAPEVSVWNRSRWLKPVSGLAVAASVALLAIVVTAPPQAVDPGAGDAAVADQANQPFVSPNTLPMPVVSQAASFDATRQTDSNALNVYLLRHNQIAQTAGRRGFVSFVPIVAKSVEPEPDEVALEQRPGKQAANVTEPAEKQ